MNTASRSLNRVGDRSWRLRLWNADEVSHRPIVAEDAKHRPVRAVVRLADQAGRAERGMGY